jgi:3-deoxy-D-manno-octulosonic-acid transferase
MRHFLYQVLVYLLLPFLLLRLFFLGFKQPHYRVRWRERLGYRLPDVPTPNIWIHAVSVGEVIATRFLVEKLRQHYPHHAILITTTTPTGSTQVKNMFQ